MYCPTHEADCHSAISNSVSNSLSLYGETFREERVYLFLVSSRVITESCGTDRRSMTTECSRLGTATFYIRQSRRFTRVAVVGAHDHRQLFGTDAGFGNHAWISARRDPDFNRARNIRSADGAGGCPDRGHRRDRIGGRGRPAVCHDSTVRPRDLLDDLTRRNRAGDSDRSRAFKCRCSPVSSQIPFTENVPFRLVPLLLQRQSLTARFQNCRF